MAKYYVDAGDLKVVIDRPTHNEAAIDAFRRLEDQPVQSLRSITIVSEQGFASETDEENENDWCFATLELLEQSDQIQNYKPE